MEIVHVKLLQTTSIFNHINWLMTKKPMKNRLQCESNSLPFEKSETFFNDKSSIHSKAITKEEMNQTFIEINKSYNDIIEKNDFGDVLLFTLKVD